VAKAEPLWFVRFERRLATALAAAAASAPVVVAVCLVVSAFALDHTAWAAAAGFAAGALLRRADRRMRHAILLVAFAGFGAVVVRRFALEGAIEDAYRKQSRLPDTMIWLASAALLPAALAAGMRVSRVLVASALVFVPVRRSSSGRRSSPAPSPETWSPARRPTRARASWSSASAGPG
jgi:hypothetical protein